MRPKSKSRIAVALLSVCLALGLTGGARAYEPRHDFDLRWDGGSVIGGYLLNPAVTSAATENSVTLSAQRLDGQPVWEVQVVQAPEQNLAGGLVVGGLDNTWAYGVAYGGDHLSAGLSVQRTGWKEAEYQYDVGAGILARAGGLSVGAAGLFPVNRDADAKVDMTAGLSVGILGISAGLLLGEEEPQKWAGIRLGSPGGGLALGYSADFDEEGQVGASTTALRIGRSKYLMIALKERGGAEEYSVGLGATF